MTDEELSNLFGQNLQRSWTDPVIVPCMCTGGYCAARAIGFWTGECQDKGER